MANSLGREKGAGSPVEARVLVSLQSACMSTCQSPFQPLSRAQNAAAAPTAAACENSKPRS